MRFKGSRHFRQRLLLSTLSQRSIIIEDIRSDESPPGLKSFEISLLRLIEKISDDGRVVINETGTKLKYKPGVVMGGKKLVHDCGVARAIGYFMEPLLILGLRGKKPLSITLKGITNDPKDPGIDTFSQATFHILERFGVPKDGLRLNITSRGSPPLGGGEVLLEVPTLTSFSAVNWTDEGRVKRIRGIAFTTNVSPQFDHQMIHAARGVFNDILPDVRIEKDHRKGEHAGRSKGYGISLVAETDSGCFISADTTICYPKVDEMDDDEEKPQLLTPEELGVHVAHLLLEEIDQVGVVDSTNQGLLFLLCALCPEDFSKVRVSKLTQYGIDTLRHIRDFLGVTFVFEPDTETNTLIVKCRGSGLPNLSRRIY